MRTAAAFSGVVVVTASLLHATPTLAQGAADTASIDLTKVLQFSVPNSPALKLIGATAEEISRPTSLKELATSILSGIDVRGRFQQGVAIEVAPVQLVHGTMDRAWYRRNLFLSNLGVSIATVKASGDNTGSNLGVGVQTVLLDRTNPVASAAFEREAVAALRACRDSVAPRRDSVAPLTQPIPTDSIPKVVACVTVADTAIGNRFRRVHWNDYVVTAAGAWGWTLANSEWNELADLGGQLWVTVAGPICFSTASRSAFCRRGQWLLEGQYETREATVDAPQKIEQLALGARVTWGSDVIGIFLELLSLHRREPAPGLKDRVVENSAGIEFRIGEDLWASSGIGSRYNDAIGESQVVVVANVRINLTSERKLTDTVPIR